MRHNARGIQKLWYLWADLLRPWHENGLTEDLQFGQVDSEGFVRGHVLRAARLTDGLSLGGTIFDMLGEDHVKKTLRAWKPKHLLLLEDLSLAWHPIWTRVSDAQPVQQIHVDRAVVLLEIYFQYLGQPRSREEIRTSVEQFIANEIRSNQQFKSC